MTFPRVVIYEWRNLRNRIITEYGIRPFYKQQQLLIKIINGFPFSSLTKDQLADLWKALRKSDSAALTKFEEFLINISSEMKKARLETVHLENTLKR